MDYGDFLNKLQDNNLHITNMNGLNFYNDFRLSLFDTEDFSYEVIAIEVDEETKRIIFKIKDAILPQIVEGET